MADFAFGSPSATTDAGVGSMNSLTEANPAQYIDSVETPGEPSIRAMEKLHLPIATEPVNVQDARCRGTVQPLNGDTCR